MRPLPIILGGILLIVAIYLVWSINNNRRAVKSRRRRNRKSDRIKLNAQQRRAYQEAQKLYKAGDYRKCARLLESLNMTREAISILEKGGHINEAAGILLRISRPNRAGMVYMRHKYWKEAAECFKKANMPNEVGKCLKEAGDVAAAVAYYLEAKNFVDAADCFVELGRHREAAKIYAKLSQHKKSLEQYQILIDKNPNFASIKLEEDERKIICTYLSRGMGDVRLADIVDIQYYLSEIIITLLKQTKTDIAQKIYMRISADVGPQLIASEELTDTEAFSLGEVFERSGSFEYAGMIFERLNSYERAGESFAKAEDFERAAYCFERCNNKQRATEMRIKLAEVGPGRPRQTHIEVKDVPNGKPLPPQPVNPFTIEETTIYDSQKTSNKQDQRATLVLPEAPSFPQDIPDPKQAHLNSSHSHPVDEKPSVATIELKMPDLPSPGFNWDGFYSSEFLIDLTKDQKDLFREVGRTQSYPRGSMILDYNDEPKGIYFVISGAVMTKKVVGGEEKNLEILHSPAYFGELWVLIDRPSQIKVEAHTEVQLVTISRADVLDIMDKHGTIARNLYRRFTQKLISRLLTHEKDKDNLAAS